jgi:uncharacterized protein YrrD
MLRSALELRGYRLDATDGEIGHVHDLLFDDRYWTVRYVVVDTGGWLSGRQVLISPASVGEVDADKGQLNVELTRERIENAPPVGADRPVSRQHEIELTSYFGWPAYWELGPVPFAGQAPPSAQPVESETSEQTSADPNLRSVNEVIGYHIRARDEEFGHVEDFVFQADDWSVNLLVIDTRPWILGKKVVVSPAAIEGVSWETRQIRVGLTAEEIKNRREFDISEQLSTG